MEGTLLLLLSGAYIGFLPDHYCDEWVRIVRLRVLPPERVTFKEMFHIAYLATNRRVPPNPGGRHRQKRADAVLKRVLCAALAI